MQEQQRPIATWMLSVMEQTGLSANKWAALAGLGRDTVSRAVKDSYAHVTTTNTLIKLAKAAGVPPPIELGATPRGIPSATILGDVFGELLRRLVPDHEWPDDLALALGKALRHTLLELADETADSVDSDRAKMAARISARQQLRVDIETPTQEND